MTRQRSTDGIRWDAGSRAIGFHTTAKKNIAKPSGKAMEHAVNFVRKHGKTRPMDYVRSSGMSFRGAMVRLQCAERAGLLRSSGHDYDIVFEVVDAGE